MKSTICLYAFFLILFSFSFNEKSYSQSNCDGCVNIVSDISVTLDPTDCEVYIVPNLNGLPCSGDYIYTWDFGDENTTNFTSLGPISHSYCEAFSNGQDDAVICLTISYTEVSNGVLISCESSICETISLECSENSCQCSIDDAIIRGFQIGCEYEYCFFPQAFTSGSTIVTGYLWELQGVGTSNEISPCFPVPGPGEYTVTLTVFGIVPETGETCSLSVTDIIKVLEVLDGCGSNGCPGELIESVNFSLEDVNDCEYCFTPVLNPDNIIIHSTHWIVNDVVVSSEETPCLTITEPSTISFVAIGLPGNGANECNDTFTVEIIETCDPCECSIPDLKLSSFAINECELRFEAETGLLCSGTELIYHWDFGDGHDETTSAPTVTHEFPDAGPFTICLTVDAEIDGELCASSFVCVDQFLLNCISCEEIIPNFIIIPNPNSDPIECLGDPPGCCFCLQYSGSHTEYVDVITWEWGPPGEITTSNGQIASCNSYFSFGPGIYNVTMTAVFELPGGRRCEDIQVVLPLDASSCGNIEPRFFDTDVSSLSSFAFENNMSSLIYPNVLYDSDDKFKIIFSQEHTDTQVRILDLAGKVIHHDSIENRDQRIVELNLPLDLKDGIYFVELKSSSLGLNDIHKIIKY